MERQPRPPGSRPGHPFHSACVSKSKARAAQDARRWLGRLCGRTAALGFLSLERAQKRAGDRAAARRGLPAYFRPPAVWYQTSRFRKKHRRLGVIFGPHPPPLLERDRGVEEDRHRPERKVIYVRESRVLCLSGARRVREAADMGRTWQPAVGRVEIFVGGLVLATAFPSSQGAGKSTRIER